MEENTPLCSDDEGDFCFECYIPEDILRAEIKRFETSSSASMMDDLSEPCLADSLQFLVGYTIPTLTASSPLALSTASTRPKRLGHREGHTALETVTEDDEEASRQHLHEIEDDLGLHLDPFTMWHESHCPIDEDRDQPPQATTASRGGRPRCVLYPVNMYKHFVFFLLFDHVLGTGDAEERK